MRTGRHWNVRPGEASTTGFTKLPGNPWTKKRPPEYRLRSRSLKAWLNRYTTIWSLFTKASGLGRFEQLRPRLDAVCSAYIARALREAGSNPVVGVEFEPEKLANELRIIPAHRRLFGRFLEILAEDNVLELADNRGRWLRPLPASDIAETIDELGKSFPEFEAILAMTERCGARLSAVLTGQTDPLHLLFPAGDLTTAEKLYQDSPSARTLNPLVREAIQAAVSAWPADRPIRILEVGAGTGGNYRTRITRATVGSRTLSLHRPVAALPRTGEG